MGTTDSPGLGRPPLRAMLQCDRAAVLNPRSDRVRPFHLRRHADSVGNHEELPCAINERYFGLQPEGPLHGNLFRVDVVRSTGSLFVLVENCKAINSLSRS